MLITRGIEKTAKALVSELKQMSKEVKHFSIIVEIPNIVVCLCVSVFIVWCTQIFPFFNMFSV